MKLKRGRKNAVNRANEFNAGFCSISETNKHTEKMVESFTLSMYLLSKSTDCTPLYSNHNSDKHVGVVFGVLVIGYGFILISTYLGLIAGTHCIYLDFKCVQSS